MAFDVSTVNFKKVQCMYLAEVLGRTDVQLLKSLLFIDQETNPSTLVSYVCIFICSVVSNQSLTVSVIPFYLSSL